MLWCLVLTPSSLTKCLNWGNFSRLLSGPPSVNLSVLLLGLQQQFKSKTVQVHLTCCKGPDRLWVDSKQNQRLEVKYLDLFFLECIFSIWKVWQNNNLTLITTKLKYTFDLNSLPLSSSPVSLMKFLNVQNYNALEKLDKD